MDDTISRQTALDALGEAPEVWTDSPEEFAALNQWEMDVKAIEAVPSENGMTFEEIAKLLSDLFDECACNVNDNDEWLPQACKYAETECPNPKEKNGCWMQFLMQGGADMRGEQDD